MEEQFAGWFWASWRGKGEELEAGLAGNLEAMADADADMVLAVRDPKTVFVPVLLEEVPALLKEVPCPSTNPAPNNTTDKTTSPKQPRFVRLSGRWLLIPSDVAVGTGPESGVTRLIAPFCPANRIPQVLNK